MKKKLKDCFISIIDDKEYTGKFLAVTAVLGLLYAITRLLMPDLFVMLSDRTYRDLLFEKLAGLIQISNMKATPYIYWTILTGLGINFIRLMYKTVWK